MNYDKDVEEDALNFLDERKDEFKEAIRDEADFDRNEIDILDVAFHENVIDRGYSLTDAAYIIEHCENEETDSGLWESLQPEEAIKAKAAWSYGLDVWFKCEEIYNKIKDTYEETLPEDAEDNPEEKEKAVNYAWDGVMKEYRPEPDTVVKGSLEEIELLKCWLELNGNAGLWSGYPLGGSYIDARYGVGYGMPDIKEYVDFDHELAKLCPHLSGKRKEEIKARLEELEGGK